MMTLVEKAPAKINLQLSVGPRRADGYHELVSVMQTVDVCDTLTVTAHTGGGIVLTCTDPTLSTGRTTWSTGPPPCSFSAPASPWTA